MTFKDLFSSHADDYQHYRPHYPDALFAYLADQVTPHDAAWDCGTGNAQGAVRLASYFLSVYATDPSVQQIEHAPSLDNLYYDVKPAEASGLPSQSVSLVTVFQALHWFDMPNFFKELDRVLLPGGLLAVIGYHTAITGLAEVDQTYREFCFDYLEEKGGWAPERKLLNNHYRDIVFPYEELTDLPAFETHMSWSYEAYIAYLNTWSAVKAYEKRYGDNPIQRFVEPRITAHWPDKTEARLVRFPLVFRCFRK